MPKTVEEILRETGLSEEQIKALDPKVTTGFTQILSSAQQAQDAAELAKRAQDEKYANEIAPALANWANRDTTISTKVAAYETWINKVKDSGYLPKEVLDSMPTFTADPNPNPNPSGRDPGTGRFVAGNDKVPGSPTYEPAQIRRETMQAITAGQWYISEYMRLNNGQMPPDDFDKIAAEAGAQRMPFKDYVEKKFDFPKKRADLDTARQKEHDDKIRAEAVAENDKKWAEKTGNNPMVRVAEASSFSEIATAVKAGTRKDPIGQGMSREQRRSSTSAGIRHDIAEHSQTVQ